MLMIETYKADAFPRGIGTDVGTADTAVYCFTYVVGNDINADLLQRLWRG